MILILFILLVIYNVWIFWGMVRSMNGYGDVRFPEVCILGPLVVLPWWLNSFLNKISNDRLENSKKKWDD